MVVGGDLVQVTQMSSSRDGAKGKKEKLSRILELDELKRTFLSFSFFSLLFSYQMSSALVFILIFSEYLTL